MKVSLELEREEILQFIEWFWTAHNESNIGRDDIELAAELCGAIGMDEKDPQFVNPKDSMFRHWM